MRSKTIILAFVLAVCISLNSIAFGQLKIAVLDSDDDIVDALNRDPRLEGIYLSSSVQLDSTFDAVVCVRSKLDTNVIDFVENGYGGIVGEYTSNEDIINQGWISGTVAVQRGTVLQSIADLNYDNHYLYSAINWGNIPFGTNPWAYAVNISITDTDAQIIATANHSVYGVIPFIATKHNPYGDGAIIILNSDWRDDPDYDVTTIKTINECVYYAATASKINVAVVPVNTGSNNIAIAINKDYRLDAKVINSSELDSTYSAVICRRNGFDANVKNYVENGYGGFVGEYTSNDSAIGNGWISGTLYSEAMSGITGLNTEYYPNHYLSNNIDWPVLPYSSNPLYYASHFEITDSIAYVVATINHTTYGENPLSVTKPNTYGMKKGNIVLLNCNYSDEPDYNSDIENMIQESAYYATMNELKVAVVPINADNSEIAEIISNDSRMYAENIHPDSLDSSYDAVVSPRHFSPEVKAFVENGYGGFVGEWSSNDSILSNNWITGSVDGNGSGIQSLNTTFNPSHYLNTSILFEDIPYNTGSFQYAHNISIDDMQANIVATMNHSIFGEIPFVVTKKNPYGPGAIVIGNSDYQDEPGYDAATMNFIQELAYYACEGYEQDYYEINIQVNGPGTTNPENQMYIPYAETDTLFILPNEYHHINEILVDSIVQIVDSVLIFTDIQTSHEVDIKFVINTFTIVSTASVGGIITPLGSNELLPLEDIIFNFEPATGYHFIDLLVDGESVDSSVSYSFISTTGNHTIHAVFEINTINIVATSGSNGSISPEGIIVLDKGEDISFSLSPETGYELNTLLIDGSNASPINPYTFSDAQTSHSIHAVYSLKKLNINASAAEGGLIVPNGNIEVDYGTDQDFVIVPNSNYSISTLSLSDSPVSLSELTNNENGSWTYTLTNVTSNDSLEVGFSLNSTNVQMSVLENVSVYPVPATDILTIDVFGIDQIIYYKLTGLDGTLIKVGEIESALFELNLSGLSEGLYVLTLVIDDSIRNIRIIKE